MSERGLSGNLCGSSRSLKWCPNPVGCGPGLGTGKPQPGLSFACNQSPSRSVHKSHKHTQQAHSLGQQTTWSKGHSLEPLPPLCAFVSQKIKIKIKKLKKMTRKQVRQYISSSPSGLGSLPSAPVCPCITSLALHHFLLLPSGLATLLSSSLASLPSAPVWPCITSGLITSLCSVWPCTTSLCSRLALHHFPLLRLALHHFPLLRLALNHVWPYHFSLLRVALNHCSLLRVALHHCSLLPSGLASLLSAPSGLIISLCSVWRCITSGLASLLSAPIY